MFYKSKRALRALFDLFTDVTWDADDKSLVASVAGQPRGDCPYLKNLDLVGAVPPCQPQTYAMAGNPST
jgi:hypothetical protein